MFKVPNELLTPDIFAVWFLAYIIILAILYKEKVMNFEVISSPRALLLFFSLFFLFFAYVWWNSLMYYNGIAYLNMYFEGYFELSIWVLASLLGIYRALKMKEEQ